MRNEVKIKVFLICFICLDFVNIEGRTRKEEHLIKGEEGIISTLFKQQEGSVRTTEMQLKEKGGAAGCAGSSSKKCAGSNTFNVKSFGAHGDGRKDDSNAFQLAWEAACGSKGDANLVIPRGTYLIGPITFSGPCDNVKSLTIHMQGLLKAPKDLRRFGASTDWIVFGWVKGLTMTGNGTFDGQGASSWPYNNCSTNKNCKLLPSNVKFVSMTKTRLRGITSTDSKFFHIVVLDCNDFHGTGIKIKAPANSPNTDGIHIERSASVSVSHSVIGTGDDCISIGQGNSHITITGISCGPGHGISVGSLGRYPNEGDVKGLLVEDCTISGTSNGIRIKTWANSHPSAASNMTFKDIVMDNVSNPIIIDQTYCPYSSCSSLVPSRVKLSDIFFQNIKGTSSSNVAVTLECSEGAPCQNVNLEDVHLDLSGGGNVAKSLCQNVQAKYSGTQIPPPCE
ncbi:Exopolygalacturonase [Thalictrum thalictroides]|uniref:Exopolygalacturonase n=1 Tax=Thalictrum thalictroides TaxID=46969 RepID=A0A7J6UZE3_THATH|nr:Exopolygalacturonase [Thalictrum thalictroides]